jgi:hypothetical protein
MSSELFGEHLDVPLRQHVDTRIRVRQSGIQCPSTQHELIVPGVHRGDQLCRRSLHRLWRAAILYTQRDLDIRNNSR